MNADVSPKTLPPTIRRSSCTSSTFQHVRPDGLVLQLQLYNRLHYKNDPNSTQLNSTVGHWSRAFRVVWPWVPHQDPSAPCPCWGLTTHPSPSLPPISIKRFAKAANGIPPAGDCGALSKAVAAGGATSTSSIGPNEN